MMKEWLVTFRSVTFAQRGERAIREKGIQCALQRTPKVISQRGCGYCLRLRDRDALRAVGILQQERLTYEKVYVLLEDGKMEERML